MKKFLNYTFLSICVLLLFFSCQKEFSLEGSGFSAGSLKNPLTGECLPDNVKGTYTVGKTLGDTNYIQVEVNVTQPGSYTINTNTVNGYSFKATGNFPNTGSNVVKLAGSGTPTIQGNNDFTITYDTSVCHIIVNVQPIQVQDPAAFTLQGTPGACMVDTLSGNYFKNIALDNNSYINVGVDVTTKGTYSVSTNIVNGYSFSGSGEFTSTGIQTITLISSGTPLNQGTDLFTITAGSSTCTFSVTVLTAVAVKNADHFPLIYHSYWTYTDLASQGDTLKKNITDSVVINGNLYKILEEKDETADPPEQYFFRKSGGVYYEYGSVDKYTNSFQYVDEVKGDILFLKEGLATGDTWASDEYVGPIQGGQPIYLQYSFFCIDANATVTINGSTFINVYKIEMRPNVRSASGSYANTGEINELYYAKGIGLIYNKSSLFAFPSLELQIKNWLVN